MRGDLQADWAIPATSAGWAGRLERFMGPGKSRAEAAVEYVGGAICLLLLVSYCWPKFSDRSVAEIAVSIVIACDVVGGVLTNATNSAKRWYHRTRSSGGRLGFVAVHTLHLAVVGFLLLDDPVWFVANTLLLLGSALLIESVPAGLRRPVAMAAYMAVLLVNLIAFPVPALLAWFVPLFYLKLLVCHLIPEVPIATRGRPRPSM
ncbi:hypothetical protein OHA40_33125 [Nocardia sp. NBC_00508]|uniref:hypothetical protein n=1 Tax=Nocardia sp. NBC_00508 TaxID=2975992 RepID=UPI002E804167|nr:hypothetical protein [Nocardia sp. NBC_00508]WUD66336.1 hypothetical protein OHA40_33125 [Nocardia sp. NBC_00508]